MKTRSAPAVWLGVVLTAAVPAAEEAPARSNMREALRARLTEEAKKPGATQPPGAAAATTADPASETKTAAPAALAPKTAAEKKERAAEVARTKAEPATVLPKVEVQKDRITELDRQVHEKDLEIAREKKNTQPSELDRALNDSKVSKFLSIFGGQSNQYRAGVAQERVRMLEDERALIEALARAKTKEERQLLQKELDDLKALRRELEKSLR